jgi:hypothetical protein
MASLHLHDCKAERHQSELVKTILAALICKQLKHIFWYRYSMCSGLQPAPSDVRYCELWVERAPKHESVEMKSEQNHFVKASDVYTNVEQH